MLCRKGMLEVGWLLEGSSLCPFAPQNAPVEASPRSKLSPNTTVTRVGMRVLKIPGCLLRKAAGAHCRAHRFQSVIFVRKPSAVLATHPPRRGSWVPKVPWGRERLPVSPGWGGRLLTPHPSAAPSHGNAGPANPNRAKSSAFSQQDTRARPLRWGSAGSTAWGAPW